MKNYNLMESLSSLPTEKSVQLEQSQLHQPSVVPVVLGPNSHIISKIKAHLDFTQTQFLRNIDWQKQLIAQINESSPKKIISRKDQSQSGYFRLSSDQQSKLKMVLQKMLGEEAQELGLRELINKAYTLRNSRLRQAEVFSSITHTENHDQKIEFPNVQRIITLNDLAPSTQRNISASPPSLPPRTPKSKAKKTNKENIQSNKAICWTPQEQINSENQQLGNFLTQSNPKEHWKRQKELVLEDSLGKRLFHDERPPIYIEESNGDQGIRSQVSLNLSLSNGGSKGQIGRISACQPKKFILADARKSGNFEKQSVYLRLSDFIAESQDKTPISKCSSKSPSVQQELPEGFLCFREPPKRRIGKCVVRKQQYYSFESDMESLRKLQDSFGQAYHEYYLCENIEEIHKTPQVIESSKRSK